MEKCQFPGVTVSVMRCKRCGHIEVSWVRQKNTEEVTEDELFEE